MAWRLAYSLEQLRAELNATFPNRDKSSDGTIGDQSHAASASDHNPNAAGVVCAFDIDTDLDGTNNSSDPQMDKLTDWFRTRPQRDIKYLIYNGRMFSAYAANGFPPFTWRPYSGSDPHRSHAHVSVGVGRDGQSVQPYDDRDSWGVAACFNQSPPPSPKPKEGQLNAIFSNTKNEVQIAEYRPTDRTVRLRGIAKGSAWYNTNPFPTGKDVGDPLSMSATQRPDGTVDVAILTTLGVQWVTGTIPGGFNNWYVPG